MARNGKDSAQTDIDIKDGILPSVGIDPAEARTLSPSPNPALALALALALGLALSLALALARSFFQHIFQSLPVHYPMLMPPKCTQGLKLSIRIITMDSASLRKDGDFHLTLKP